MAKTIPSSIRLSGAMKKLIKRTARKVGMTEPETHRQAVVLGCPELVKRLKQNEPDN